MVGLVRDPLFLLHDNGPGHPENPARLRAVNAMVERLEVRDRLADLSGRDATHEELSWVHREEYLARIAATQGAPHTMLDPDTSANEHSWPAAVRAAGAVLSGLEGVAAGRWASAVALVRPPGHHAEADRAMGFCLVNNVAVAAEFARRRLGRDRVLVVDWDVHHGNGTMHSFYDSGRRPGLHGQRPAPSWTGRRRIRLRVRRGPPAHRPPVPSAGRVGVRRIRHRAG